MFENARKQMISNKNAKNYIADLKERTDGQDNLYNTTLSKQKQQYGKKIR
jgi:hypothetical protein